MTKSELTLYLVDITGKTKERIENALSVVHDAILKRRRWEFLRREKAFTATIGENEYTLADHIADSFDDRYISVKVGNRVLTYKSPKQLDLYKAQLISPPAQQSTDNLNYFTFRSRDTGFIPILELDMNPATALTITVGYFIDDALDYLCKHWSAVLIAGITACVVSRRKIRTSDGAIIEEEPTGHPEGDVSFEEAIAKMLENTEIMPEENLTVLDPYISDQMDLINEANT